MAIERESERAAAAKSIEAPKHYHRGCRRGRQDRVGRSSHGRRLRESYHDAFSCPVALTLSSFRFFIFYRCYALFIYLPLSRFGGFMTTRCGSDTRLRQIYTRRRRETSAVRRTRRSLGTNHGSYESLLDAAPRPPRQICGRF